MIFGETPSGMIGRYVESCKCVVVAYDFCEGQD